MVKEEFRAIFLGCETISILWCKIEDDNLYIRKPNKTFPFASSWVLKLGNISDKLKVYDERVLLSPDDGRSKETVRIYNFDLDDATKTFHSIGNARMEREVESLRKERDFLFQSLKDMEDKLKTAGMGDLIKTRFKTEYNYFTSLKPGHMYNDDDKKKGDKKK